MKEVKIILLMLYVAGYTSLIFANAMFDWIKITDMNGEKVAVGAILFILLTIVNLVLIIAYLVENW